jgi:hypothetical protein
MRPTYLPPSFDFSAVSGAPFPKTEDGFPSREPPVSTLRPEPRRAPTRSRPVSETPRGCRRDRPDEARQRCCTRHAGHLCGSAVRSCGSIVSDRPWRLRNVRPECPNRRKARSVRRRPAAAERTAARGSRRAWTWRQIPARRNESRFGAAGSLLGQSPPTGRPPGRNRLRVRLTTALRHRRKCSPRRSSPKMMVEMNNKHWPRRTSPARIATNLMRE